jgi:hypothetical protein
VLELGKIVLRRKAIHESSNVSKLLIVLWKIGHSNSVRNKYAHETVLEKPLPLAGKLVIPRGISVKKNYATNSVENP